MCHFLHSYKNKSYLPYFTKHTQISFKLATTQCLTRDFSFEWASNDMLWSSVFDGNEVAAGGHGCVRDLVTLRTLLAVHLYLGGSVNGDRKSASSSVNCVYDKLRRYTFGGRKDKR